MKIAMSSRQIRLSTNRGKIEKLVRGGAEKRLVRKIGKKEQELWLRRN
jgi:hypothetical protein